MAADLILTSGGLAMTRDFLAAESPAFVPHPPRYIALSSGTSPVGRFFSSLPGETFRAPIIARTITENTITFRAFLGDTENNNQIVGRYGIIAGNDADSLPGGGGTLIAVAGEQSPFSKDATKTLTVNLSLTVSGSVS